MNIRTVSYAIASLLPIAALEVWIFFFLETKRRSRAIRLHWYVVMSFIFFLGVTYVWKKLSLLFQSNGYLSLRGLARVAAIVVLLMAQSCLVLSLIFVDKEPLALSIASSYCLGFVIFLTISSAAVDIGAWLIYKLLLRRTGPKATAKTLLSLLLALAMTASGMYSLSQLEVNHVTLPIKGLHPSLNGTTLVQLSDIHLGPFSGHSALKDLVGRVNGLKPDLVLITGDLVDSTVSSLREAVTPLKDLTPKHGVYFCTGNHEYYTGDVDSWIEELPRHGVTPLVNKRVCLFGEEKQGCSGGLYLAGLEDIETRRINYGPHSMDLHAALSSRGKGVPTIVMAHQPWAAVEAVMWEDVHLVLSGHTHAGQFLPMTVLVYFFNPFFAGLYEPSPGVYVYVNAGSLYVLVPYRHFFGPEITHFILVSA